MAQWVTALATQGEGWVFESQPRQTEVIKTGSGSSISKRSAIGVSVTGPLRWPFQTDAPYACHRGCVTLKNCSMAMSAEHRSEFAALHRQWWRLHEWKILEWDDKPQKTNKQTNYFTKYLFCAAWRPIYVQKVALIKTQCYLQCTIRTHCNPKQNFFVYKTRSFVYYIPNKLFVKCNIIKTSE